MLHSHSYLRSLQYPFGWQTSLFPPGTQNGSPGSRVLWHWVYIHIAVTEQLGVPGTEGSLEKGLFIFASLFKNSLKDLFYVGD